MAQPGDRSTPVDVVTEEEAQAVREIEEEDRRDAEAAGAGHEEANPEDEIPPQEREEQPPRGEAEPKRREQPAQEQVEETEELVDEPLALMTSAMPENYEARVKEIGEKIDGLGQKMENGELTLTEYHKEMRVLTQQESDLQRQKSEAEFAARNNEQRVAAVWDATVSRYIGQNHDLRHPGMRAAWDVEFKALVAAEEKKGQDHSMLWYLEQSHRRTRESLGLPPRQGQQPQPREEAATTRRRPAAVQTLHDMPAAANTDTGTEEFANIDALEGIEAELALEDLHRKNPQAYARYLRQG